jgi:hypothetical protein
MTVPRSPSFTDIPDPVGATAGESPSLPDLVRRLATDAPDREQTRRRRRAALVLSLGWLGSHLAVFGLRHDLRQLPPAYLASHVGVPLVLALASLYVATRPGRWGLGWPALWVGALALGGPLSFWVLGAITPAPRLSVHDAKPWLGALVCSDLMLVWMSVPLFAAAVALRGAFVTTAVWRSALVGASVGLASGVTINLHCANVEPFHLVLGHGVPIALASLLGAFVVRHWLRP